MNILRCLLCLTLLSTAIGFTSCGDDEAEETVLNYDGDNVTGPQFLAGEYVTAARFPNLIMRAYTGQTITALDIYILEVPNSAEVIIYGGDGSDASPATEIQSQNVSLRANSWNRIPLSTPYLVDGSEIWLGLLFGVDRATQVTGCDAGPANANGDYLFQNSDRQWTTFRGLTTTESINWNIRAIISEF